MIYITLINSLCHSEHDIMPVFSRSDRCLSSVLCFVFFFLCLWVWFYLLLLTFASVLDFRVIACAPFGFSGLSWVTTRSWPSPALTPQGLPRFHFLINTAVLCLHCLHFGQKTVPLIGTGRVCQSLEGPFNWCECSKENWMMGFVTNTRLILVFTLSI